jgi:uncharacterized alkaline shock family protein YloU
MSGIIPQELDLCKRGNLMSDRTDRGRVEVSPNAVATIANHAVLNSYGVVGMSAKNLVDGIAQVLRPDSKRGVEVQIDEDQITIDLYVVIEYGVRVATVARNIMSSVKFSVEKAIGVPLKAVNVHVQGLHVSAEENQGGRPGRRARQQARRANSSGGKSVER